MKGTSLTFDIPAAVLDALREEVTAAVLTELRASGQLGASVESPFLTVAEAAKRMRCKPQRVHDLLSQRKLSRWKDGGRTLVSREEVDARIKLERPALVRSRTSQLGS